MQTVGVSDCGLHFVCFGARCADPVLKIVNNNQVYNTPDGAKPVHTSDGGLEVRLGALARVAGDVKITVSGVLHRRERAHRPPSDSPLCMTAAV